MKKENWIKEFLDKTEHRVLMTKEPKHELGEEEIYQFSLVKKRIANTQAYSRHTFTDVKLGTNMGSAQGFSYRDSGPRETFNEAVWLFQYLNEWQGGIKGLNFKAAILASRNGSGMKEWNNSVNHNMREIVMQLEKIALAFALEPGLTTMNVILNKVSHNLFVELVACKEEAVKHVHGNACACAPKMAEFTESMHRLFDFIRDGKSEIGYMGGGYGDTGLSVMLAGTLLTDGRERTASEFAIMPRARQLAPAELINFKAAQR